MRPDVRLRSGQRLLGGGTVFCARAGRLQKVDVGDLAIGDWVALSFEPELAEQPVTLDKLEEPALYRGQKRVDLPAVLDADLALLLGMYASEGHTSRSVWSVVVTNSEAPVLHRCQDLWRTCFGLHARIEWRRERCPAVIVDSKSAVLFLESLGCGGRAREKRIPREVMDSPLEVVRAYLQGLALDAYTSTTGHNAKWAICLDSPLLLDDLQTMLRRLGIVSGRIGKYNAVYDKTYDEVFVSGAEAQRLLELVPFLEPSKQASAARLSSMAFDESRNGADVRNMVHRFAAQGFRLPWDVQRVLDENLHFSQVISTADTPGNGGRRPLAAMGG